MLKKVITYTNFFDEEVTETFYFNLTKAELIKLELGYEGGLSQRLEKIVNARSGRDIIEAFEEIIKASYGERSEDGRRFIKSSDISESFMSSEAYSILFEELVTDANAAAEFINGLIPKGVDESTRAQISQKTEQALRDQALPEDFVKTQPITEEPRRTTLEEVSTTQPTVTDEMTRAQLEALLRQQRGMTS